MSEASDLYLRVEAALGDLRAGDTQAREKLLAIAGDRLTAITRKIKRDFPAVSRWEQTDDVFQNASLRLYRALGQVEIEDARHFFRLAATQVRRELIDMARKYQGPQGSGANHHTIGRAGLGDDGDQPPPAWEGAELTNEPGRVTAWGELHEAIEQLPDDEREVTELLWYHQLPQADAAEILKVDVRTIKRRWRSARLKLHEKLGESPLE
ncbi:MAG: sigma-70 family RNA polymerase sigma factor [Planctomycetota bacterium]